METVLGELWGKMCFIYIDDIIIYSTLSDMAFPRSLNHPFHLKKSKLLSSGINFSYWHVVNGKGISADPSKVKAIRSYPVSKNLKEVRHFLGLVGWYYRFVPHFSQIAEPINALKKEVQFWVDISMPASFQSVKNLSDLWMNEWMN